jgi:Methyltransferase domain
VTYVVALPKQSDEISVYYQHSGAVPLASWVSLVARRRMFRLFMDAFQPGPETTVLDVGVTCDTSFAESNYFEQLYPYPRNIVCVGTEDGSHLMQTYPGLRYQQVRPGEPLPFADRDFDIVFSNAVLEHVGSREAQRAFVREHALFRDDAEPLVSGGASHRPDAAASSAGAAVPPLDPTYAIRILGGRGESEPARRARSRSPVSRGGRADDPSRAAGGRHVQSRGVRRNVMASA